MSWLLWQWLKNKDMFVKYKLRILNNFVAILWFIRNIYIWLYMCVSAVYSVTSVMSDSVIPWTVARQGPLSMGFSRQEYWNRLPFPSPGALPDTGIKLWSHIYIHIYLVKYISHIYFVFIYSFWLIVLKTFEISWKIRVSLGVSLL